MNIVALHKTKRIKSKNVQKQDKVIGSGKTLFSKQSRVLLVALAVVVVGGIGSSGYALWKNLSANAGGTSTLGRGWTTLGSFPTSGLSYSAQASVCKVADPATTDGSDLQGRVTITSGTATDHITSGIYTSTPDSWNTGNSIDIASGQISTTAFTPSISPDVRAGVVLYGPDYTIVSNDILVSEIQSC